MNTNEKKYYDVVMTAYVNGSGHLAFKDRTILSKERQALGILAAEAIAIEESVKGDYQRMAADRERQKVASHQAEADRKMKEAEARLQEESARVAAEQRKKSEELERRQQAEAKAKAEAEEKERKLREEREAAERAENEARRVKAELEAREDAERLEEQQRRRRAKEDRERSVRKAKRNLAKLWTILFGIAPLAAAYTAYQYYAVGHVIHAGVITGAALVCVLLYYFGEFDLKWLYAICALAIIGGCVYDYLHLTLNSWESPGWDIFVKNQIAMKMSVASALVLLVLSSYHSSSRGRGVFHIIISVLCGLAIVPLFRGDHWKIGSLLGAIVAAQILGWLFNAMSRDADLDGGLIRPTRMAWLIMCVPFGLAALAGNSGHWIIATILAIIAGTCITYYEAMICGSLVIGIAMLFFD